MTSIHKAAAMGKTNEVQELLDKGVEVDVRDKEGRTPLHEAAIWCRPETASLLIRYGADVDAKDNDGDTPLHWTIKQNLYGGQEIIKLLIGNGADVYAIGKYDFSVLDCTAVYRNTIASTLIRSHIAGECTCRACGYMGDCHYEDDRHTPTKGCGGPYAKTHQEILGEMAVDKEQIVDAEATLKFAISDALIGGGPSATPPDVEAAVDAVYAAITAQPIAWALKKLSK